jgi:hypothetical protein
VYTDVFLFFTEVPYHIRLAAAFTRVAEERLAARGLADWEISHTGHSLGAVIAACCACREGRRAVTFDSPGEAGLLERMGLPEAALDAVQGGVVCYLSKPNLANTLRKHAGVLVKLVTAVDTDHDVVHVERLTELLREDRRLLSYVTDPLALVRSMLLDSLPRPLDENLGLKANYLLRHRDRHMMRLFKRTLLGAAVPAQERVLQWPVGPLQCFLYDSCDSHLASATQGTSLGHASAAALQTVYAVAPAQGTLVEPADTEVLALLALPAKLCRLPGPEAARRLEQHRARVPQERGDALGLVFACIRATRFKSEGPKITGAQLPAFIGKHEYAAMVQRWREDLTTILRLGPKLRGAQAFTVGLVQTKSEYAEVHHFGYPPPGQRVPIFAGYCWW